MESNNLNLTPSNPVSLIWTNKQDITFKINYSIDDQYMFTITQEIENNSNQSISISISLNQKN